MKIIHCFRMPLGGLFRHVTDLIHLQISQGAKTGIICDARVTSEYAEDVLNNLADICELGLHRLIINRAPSFADIGALRQASQICSELQPDIIHGHGAKGGAYSRLLRKQSGPRSFYTPHGGTLHYSPYSPSGSVYIGLERLLNSRTDAMIFESQFSAATYEAKVSPITCRYKIIHNGVADSEIVTIAKNEERFDFLFIGEFRNLKGLNTLLSAIARIREERPIRALLAGSGPGSNQLIRKIKSLQLQDSIEVSPPIFPATAAFPRAKCLVVPSLAESLPYIVLEAAAAGIPLIATKVGGIPEIYGSFCETLIEPSNPEALALAMRAAMDRPDLADAGAAELKERIISSFSMSRMGQDIFDFYKEVLATEAS